MVSSDFLSRVSAYPIVTSAFQRASASLAWAKDRSAAARTAAGVAENGLRRVAGGAGPLLSRFEGRIADLDRLACRQLLDRLETACPTVLQPTDKVVERGRDFYSETVKPKVELVLSPVTATVAKVQSAKSAGLKRYRQAVESRPSQAGLHQFDHLIQVLSDSLDKLMPPASAEKEEEKTAKKIADDEADKDAGDVEKAKADEAPADPARSLALAYDLGRKVSVRVSDRVTEQGGRLATVGHRLVDRLLGRPASASDSASDSASATLASTGASSVSSTRPPSGEAEAKHAGEAEEPLESEESQLDRSDMSTD